ncbi:DUF4097 family beta strand repeat-containing protein [Carboxylicivirga sp. M1479]|uniref:DUF4097 family beta strand repeat-containing protein n=1 Tax=Carboxylicivirga sp. M1479 TaxID=2594476 RepID=UPI001178CABB|nr:DUF4097 family beta strand repeat-containing protein [Carboxylicivirga sp. M1479]TRX65867.1 hypothetical protein FNN09_16385 [Carboxylicivirga sp. M1479]
MRQLITLLCLISLPLVYTTKAQNYAFNKSEEAKDEIKNGEPIEKNYDAAPINELVINNEHGYITVSPWDQESINIRAVVHIETTNEEEAKEILEFLSFEEKRFSHKLQFSTVFDEHFFSNYTFTVNYDIKVPSRLNISVNNTIGDVKINDIKGIINLKHSYGNLDISNIGMDKEHTFELSFIEGVINTLGSAKAKLSNCTLNINNATSIKGQTSYCMASIVNTQSLNINTFTDRLIISNTDSLTLKGEQFIGKVEQLKNYLFCELKKGKLTVDTQESLSELTISNKRVETSITVPPSLSYIINGEVTNGSFTHPSPQMLQVFKENDNVTFSGKVGNEINAANLILFNKDASITIKN